MSSRTGFKTCGWDRDYGRADLLDVPQHGKLQNYVTGSGAGSGLGADAYSGGGPGRE
jgi:hypothetical protein